MNGSSVNLEDLLNETFIQLDTTTDVREEEVVGEDDQNKTSHAEVEKQSNMADSDDPNSEGNNSHKHEEQLQPTDLPANQNQVNAIIFTDLVTNIRIRTTKADRQQYQCWEHSLNSKTFLSCARTTRNLVTETA